jgi:hypothetical protein
MDQALFEQLLAQSQPAPAAATPIAAATEEPAWQYHPLPISDAMFRQLMDASSSSPAPHDQPGAVDPYTGQPRSPTPASPMRSWQEWRGRYSRSRTSSPGRHPRSNSTQARRDIEARTEAATKDSFTNSTAATISRFATGMLRSGQGRGWPQAGPIQSGGTKS